MIVDASGDQIDVLADAFGSEGNRRRGRGRKADVAIAHEQMIPLNSERPIRSETIFPADTGDSAPAGLPRRVKDEVR